MKKLASLILALSLCLALAIPAFAAQSDPQSVTLDGWESSITLANVLGKRTAVVDEATVDVYVIPAEGSEITFTAKSFDEDGAPNASIGQTVYTGTNGTYTTAGGVFWGILNPGTFTLNRNEENEVFTSSGYSFDTSADAVYEWHTTDGLIIFYAYASDDAAAATVYGFTDIPINAYYTNAVKWAIENSITNGTSNTTFSPDDTCTTAQILTFLHRAKGTPAPTRGNPYSNVKSGDYFYNAALWAGENSLTGNSGSFNGGTPCTRAAVVTYLWKLAGEPSAENAAFSDVPASADYAQAVAWAVVQGITHGTGGTMFSPDATCTRGQIVTFLYRAYAK